jgi:nitrite reductase/ring-hydroxylating ferredoxin subunit
MLSRGGGGLRPPAGAAFDGAGSAVAAAEVDFEAWVQERVAATTTAATSVLKLNERRGMIALDRVGSELIDQCITGQVTLETRMSFESGAEDCAGACSVPASRRHFLRQSFMAAAVALVAVGMTGSAAAAMPLEFVEGESSDETVTYPVPTADGAQIDKKNEVILVRWLGTVYAFNLACPHQNTVLKWDDKDKEFSCPKHHSRFKIDGAYIEDSGRATRNMDRFAITRDGANVRVNLDQLYEADKDTTEWAAATVKVVPTGV